MNSDITESLGEHRLREIKKFLKEADFSGCPVKATDNPGIGMKDVYDVIITMLCVLVQRQDEPHIVTAPKTWPEFWFQLGQRAPLAVVIFLFTVAYLYVNGAFTFGG